MKKLILLALTAIIMAGCKDIKTVDGYSVIEVDSCEYIASINQLSHKGNCRFCEERRKKELEELVIKLKGE